VIFKVENMENDKEFVDELSDKYDSLWVKGAQTLWRTKAT
jgi:hypothetical protein